MKQYMLGQYEKSMPNRLSLSEKLLEVKKIGFDFLEMSIDETDEKLERLKYSPKKRLQLIQAMYEADTRILTMCLSGHRKYPIGSEDDTIRHRGMEIMEDAIQLAEDLGIRIIQIAGYDEYYRPSNAKTEEYFLTNLFKSVEIASKHSVMLAFETMETPFMDTISKAKKIVDLINSPYLKIYPDVGNISNAALKYNINIDDDISLGNGLIAAMHLKETRIGEYREVPFGQGCVQFSECIRLAKKQNVRIFVGEFWNNDDRQWENQAQYANEFLREHLDSIFID